jgi:cytochrome b6-f complex iron-sulfur subunit
MPDETAPSETRKVTRREFVWYAWASSIALFMAGSTGATIAFAYPRFKEGEFGGKFYMGMVDEIEEGSVTVNREGKFFLVRAGTEFKALFQVCTHLGCLVRVTPEGYACPCHGSKFARNGRLVASPAPRDMDEFLVEITEGEVWVEVDSQDFANFLNGEPHSGGEV